MEGEMTEVHGESKVEYGISSATQHMYTHVPIVKLELYFYFAYGTFINFFILECLSSVRAHILPPWRDYRLD